MDELNLTDEEVGALNKTVKEVGETLDKEKARILQEQEIEQLKASSSFWKAVFKYKNLRALSRALDMTPKGVMRKMAEKSRTPKPRKPKRGGEKAWNEWRLSKKLARGPK